MARYFTAEQRRCKPLEVQSIELLEQILRELKRQRRIKPHVNPFTMKRLRAYIANFCRH